MRILLKAPQLLRQPLQRKQMGSELLPSFIYWPQKLISTAYGMAQDRFFGSRSSPLSRVIAPLGTLLLLWNICSEAYRNHQGQHLGSLPHPMGSSNRIEDFTTLLEWLGIISVVIIGPLFKKRRLQSADSDD